MERPPRDGLPVLMMADQKGKNMRKYNYYGLENGQELGKENGRNESYFFRIYADGSASVMIRQESGKIYTFGNIEHCRRLYRNGISFHNRNGENRYKLSDAFVAALSA